MGCWRGGLLLVLAGSSVFPATAGAQNGTLVLPLRTVGVSDTTATVSRDLLEGDLEELGVIVVRVHSIETQLPAGAEGCDASDCAAELAAAHGAESVVYGSLSKLGGKIIARVRALRGGESTPFYRDQLSALSEDELDTVMRRVAEGIAGGRGDSERPALGTVTLEEAQETRLRAGRRGIGVRGAFLFPTGDSYGEADHLTGLRLVYKFERERFLIETTTLLGLMWGDGSVEWSLLDVYGARIFGLGDVSSYIGGGLGIHLVHVEGPEFVPTEYAGYPYTTRNEQSETTLTLDAGVGLLALRTYDFELVVDLRYHHVFDDFNRVNGKGANGITLSFGTSR